MGQHCVRVPYRNEVAKMTLREFLMFLVNEATTERLDAEVFLEVEGDVRPARSWKASNALAEMVSPDEIVLHSCSERELEDDTGDQS